ncbi:MAG: SUMF1/EgtB/PvdO family nonheme iron enzyme [Acidobacteria bacterium]|nr:SUMF1/EgtB/PvdO family nonheme iron enzyme [Acidobacteriota bacterium]
MLRKFGIVLFILTLVLGLSACGGKEEADMEATEPAMEGTAPQRVSGEMVLVPEGEFILGTEDTEHPTANYPARTMNLPAFYIDKYEVTNMEFMDFSINENYAGEGAKEGKDWRIFYTLEKANVPVVFITFNDAATYCKSKGKRLPTEFEWEKAARGTEGFRYPWGNDWEENRTNTYESGYESPVSVGQFNDVSPYGVHDMMGNVQEWTTSPYLPYKGSKKRDANATEDMKVVRGLSYVYRGRMGSIFERTAYVPNYLSNFGFRCAKDAAPEETDAAR